MKCKYCLSLINKLTRAKHVVCPCYQVGVHYCDKVCQSQDWGKGGHKNECDYFEKLSQQRAESSRAGKSTSSLDNGKQPSPSRPNDVEREKSGSRERETSNAASQERNAEGRFHADNDQQTLRKKQQALSSRNYSDFKAAKVKLQGIIDRNRSAGKDWAFKITCQKDSKNSRQRAHCWTSENYDDEILDNQDNPDEEDEEDEEAEEDNISKKVGPKRVCINCKNRIVGAQSSYLVCCGTGCRRGMTHFECLGFPDISAELAKMMKSEYMCGHCHSKIVKIANQEADFEEDQEQEEPPRKKQNRNTNTSSSAQATITEESISRAQASRVPGLPRDQPGSRQKKTSSAQTCMTTGPAQSSKTNNTAQARNRTTTTTEQGSRAEGHQGDQPGSRAPQQKRKRDNSPLFDTSDDDFFS